MKLFCQGAPVLVERASKTQELFNSDNWWHCAKHATLHFCKVLFLCSFLSPLTNSFHRCLWNAYDPGTLLGARIAARNKTNQASVLLDPVFLTYKQIRFLIGMNALEQDQVTVTVRIGGHFRYCHLGMFNILLNPSCLHPFSASVIPFSMESSNGQGPHLESSLCLVQCLTMDPCWLLSK